MRPSTGSGRRIYGCSQFFMSLAHDHMKHYSYAKFNAQIILIMPFFVAPLMTGK